MVVVVSMAVVLAEDTSVEEASVAVVTSAVDQDSVVVRSMEEWAISPNVTMQIGTGTGTGTMATSSTIGSLFLTTVSGSDWMDCILTTITMGTTTRIITHTMRPPIHIRCRQSVPSNRTWPGKVTIAV